ncbi:protein hairy-like [Onthophagus taurus]|uniref:protein hairy-like n=1 Tax=Onthophagus taurus TaxID=166361 RepID=UPI000C207780|nr:protein hairy-like [Onthophagus taurus]
MVTTEDVSVSSSTMPGSSAITHQNLDQKIEKKSENRRSNKPIMEKRRRARINNCLNELKGLILEATKRDPARHSKLEKADILEMTVRYLQDNKSKEQSISPDTLSAGHFKAGFTVCANAVSKFPGLEPSAKRTLLHHISNCWNQQPVVLPSTNEIQQNPRILLPNNTSIQIVPNSNGDIFLLPATQSTQNLPLLVPIPQRTASTCSSASSSRSESPQEIEDSPKPLALVIRREEDHKKEVWRPF